MRMQLEQLNSQLLGIWIASPVPRGRDMARTQILTIAGIGVLAVVAILGWTRKTETPAVLPLADSTVSAYDGPAAVEPAYANPRSVRTIEQPPPPPAPTYTDESVTHRQATRRSRRVITRERPFSHSLGIVGGSAGAGAAIGAL